MSFLFPFGGIFFWFRWRVFLIHIEYLDQLYICQKKNIILRIANPPGVTGASHWLGLLLESGSPTTSATWSRPIKSLPYCWWKKSCTTWDKLPSSTGAGFQPSTVVMAIISWGWYGRKGGLPTLRLTLKLHEIHTKAKLKQLTSAWRITWPQQGNMVNFILTLTLW